jgi:hypothetical protein
MDVTKERSKPERLNPDIQWQAAEFQTKTNEDIRDELNKLNFTENERNRI